MCNEHINWQQKQEEEDGTIPLPLLSPAHARSSPSSRPANFIDKDTQAVRASTPLEEVDLPTTPLPEIRTQELDNVQTTLVLRRQISQRRSKSRAGTHSPSKSWGLLPQFSVICAIGVFLVALAYEGGRLSIPRAEILFWTGLLILFLPVVIRLFASKPARRERIGLLVILSISLYLVAYFEYPLYFTGYDDFSHWRTAYDIAASGHLFHTNPLLPISPYYPGMEIFTTALSSLTGLSLYASGILLIGVAHLIFALALYLFFEHFTDSPRMAGIAAVLYMANPGYLFFDMSYAYESLALPLAVFVLFAVARRSKAPTSQRLGLNVVIVLGLGAVVVTHHLTSFFLVGFLLLWTAILLILRAVAFIRRSSSRRDRIDYSPLWAALAGLVLEFIWLRYTGYRAIGYLLPHVQNSVQQVLQILANKSAPRQLFHNTSGFVVPLWERLFSYASVALILIGLAFGLFKLLRSHRTNVAILALAVAALAYPVSQALRLTPAGAESGNRATEFVFLGVAFVLALFAVKFWSSRKSSWRRSAIILGAATVICFGQLVLGSGQPWALLPGPYLVSADNRSIEPEGITAAKWANAYLKPGQYVASDRINTLLMATDGDEYVVTGTSANLPVQQVFTSLRFGAGVIGILQVDGIQYLVVDHRLSTSLPYVGTYFNLTGASGQSAQEIQSAALTKFDSVQNVDRIFDSGNIVIYNVENITHPPAVIPPTYCKPTPSTAAISFSSPNVALNYTGTLYDISASVTTGITLTGMQALKGGICGSLGGLPTPTHT
ncbi:MAG TPA: hypothetical protein VEH81_15960, partial [Ktedonobacteraceae bacterium]|nr:hypothetical protein [Ktedonobacteraceae bacterium]